MLIKYQENVNINTNIKQYLDKRGIHIIKVKTIFIQQSNNVYLKNNSLKKNVKKLPGKCKFDGVSRQIRN